MPILGAGFGFGGWVTVNFEGGKFGKIWGVCCEGDEEEKYEYEEGECVDCVVEDAAER